MCTRMYTFPDVHIRVHPTSRKEQKYPDQYTQAHPPPVGYTRYFHPRCVPPCAPTTRYVQQSVLPQDVSIPGTRGCKREQEASPEGTRKRRMKGPSVETWRGRAPVRPPPSPWMPVWCAMAQRSARPCRRSSPLGPGPARLGSPGLRAPEDVATQPSLAQLPGRCRRTRPQSAPPPEGEADRGGHWCRACAQRAPGSGWLSAGPLPPSWPRRGPGCVCVCMVTCRPRSWRSVCGSALGRGRDCALAAEEVWE